MKRVFLLGSNIENSLSPFIHNYWLKKYQIEGIYEAISLNTAQAPVFLRNFAKQGFVGGNVTMPFKKMAYYLSDKYSNWVGGANTLWLENNEIIAGSSDYYGFKKLLEYHGFGKINEANSRSALILGSGGASKAVAAVLSNIGYFVSIASRKSTNCELPKYTSEIVQVSYENIFYSDVDLIVNTTPCTMQNYDSESFLQRLNLAERVKYRKEVTVIDLNYVPAQTALIKQAQELGLSKTANGLVMLVEQASWGFEVWFGKKLEKSDIQEMIDILQEVL